MNKLNQNQKLGEIVSIFPQSVQIFNRYKIDYCCGGHDKLVDAIIELELPIESIINELNHAYEKFINSKSDFIDWRKETPLALINHILDTHHVYTRNSIKELDYLITKILKVHFEHHQNELLQVHRLFGLLKIEIEEHLIKEEEQLFPLIEHYEHTKNDDLLNKLKQYVIETENEHDGAGEILKELSKVTNDYQAPSDGCTTFHLVYSKLQALQNDLFRHIYLENSVLFEMLNLNLH